MKGKVREAKRTRMEQQLTQTLKEILAELLQTCDRGTKSNAQGYKKLKQLQTAPRHGGLRHTGERAADQRLHVRQPSGGTAVDGDVEPGDEFV